ncbi:MAG: hypothetical protein QM755_12495 [Luteolibacter sp.]
MPRFNHRTEDASASWQRTFYYFRLGLLGLAVIATPIYHHFKRLPTDPAAYTSVTGKLLDAESRGREGDTKIRAVLLLDSGDEPVRYEMKDDVKREDYARLHVGDQITGLLCPKTPVDSDSQPAKLATLTVNDVPVMTWQQFLDGLNEDLKTTWIITSILGLATILVYSQRNGWHWFT